MRPNPDLAFERCDIRDLTPAAPVFADASFRVPLWPAIGGHRPVDRAPDRVHADKCARDRPSARGGAPRRHREIRLRGLLLVLRGLPRLPTREDHPMAPQYPYALSKYFGEQTALHWHLVYRLPVNSVRIFNAYGTRVRTTGAYGAVFGVFLKQKLAGKPFTVVGDGSQRRDFVYASDVAEAFLRAAEDAAERRDLEPRRWRSAIGQPARRADRRPGFAYSKTAPASRTSTWADIGKIERELGWQPRISFKEGGEPHDGRYRQLAGCTAVGTPLRLPRRPARGFAISVRDQSYDGSCPRPSGTRSRRSKSCATR